ncbi:hypothetical protein [Tumebacillus flagellatus]|uniref:Uncharacterized protein n=1 Tax=Tumebacillus flagellatus TaxID=1157490 RepID=A0A074LTJ2_9BACL|nr:hypothetical protein [Tumebacillus flagellatus]KEO83895.1 hypothetical protein EL26_06825 [Tumebacillus flagellatus]
MHHANLLEQYHRIRALTPDVDTWLESPIGSDLWVDGLNVFLTVEPEDFEAALQAFPADTPLNLETLHNFCLQEAKTGEFELYRALAVGMTWLSLQPETNGQFFNRPVQVTNHSTALLLSPSYRAIWAHAYNRGYELVIDVDTKRQTIFRPEHGRIYQKSTWHQSGQSTVRYPYMHYFHEMSHLCLFGDLYARVLGGEAEDASAYVHMEAVITALEENVIAEIRQVGYELNVIEDSLGAFDQYPEAGEFRMKIHRGEVEGLTPHEIIVYLRRSFQLGEGDSKLPENAVKDRILRNHQLPEEQLRLLDTHYCKLVNNLQLHAFWALKASERNRIPGYREVVDLLPRSLQCLHTFEACLHPETPLSRLLSFDTLQPPNPAVRAQSKLANAWKELLYRIAEIRGYLEQQGEQTASTVQDQLLQLAQRVVDHSQLDLDSRDQETRLNELRDELHRCIASIENRPELQEMISHPFGYLLEPR